MQILIDFFTFETLISEHALILFYFMGAVLLPIFVWIVSFSLTKRYLITRQTAKMGTDLFKSLPWRYQAIALSTFLLMFFMMELFWRMMFEYLIAFMQIRDALTNH